MAIVLPPPRQMEQKVILHGVSWETYERLLADFADSHAAHFAYDQGMLEIMVLSFRHEMLNRTLATLVETPMVILRTEPLQPRCRCWQLRSHRLFY